MFKKASEQKDVIKRVALSTFSSLIVLIIVAIVTFFMLGYRLNVNGGVEQYAFLQFASNPSGAYIDVDGSVIGKTPNKTSVPAGEHKITITKDGYKTWTKTVTITSGTLTWLDYALLIPSDLTNESVMNIDSVYDSLTSRDNNYILIQKSANLPDFIVVNVSSSSTSSSSISIPDTIYTNTGSINTYQIMSWDESERYVLIKHTYDNSVEWIVLDTQNVSSSVNLTKTFDISISKAEFIGNNGNSIYVLNSGDLRKLDISSGTISKTLISDVTDFNYYNESNMVTYTTVTTSGDTKERNVGIYNGSSDPYILRTIDYDENTPLLIATTHYFNEDYIAIAEGKKIDILGGSYPTSNSDSSDNLSVIETLTLSNNVESLSFSPSGEFAFIRSGELVATYDLEYENLSSMTIDGLKSSDRVKWLNDNYIWYNIDGNLTIREFDGDNQNTISTSLTNQDVVLTDNVKYIYSVQKADSGYRLIRTKLTN